MDLLLISRDALASSLLGSMLLAMEARKRGQEVAVLLTQEALAAAVSGSFEWPREFSGQDTRLKMADAGAAMGLPLLGRGEGRQLDVKALIGEAQKTGVSFYACQTWLSLLRLEEALPEGITPVNAEVLLDLVKRANRVVGGL